MLVVICGAQKYNQKKENKKTKMIGLIEKRSYEAAHLTAQGLKSPGRGDVVMNDD